MELAYVSHNCDAPMRRIADRGIGGSQIQDVQNARYPLTTILCPEDTGRLPKELVDFARRQIVNATLYKGSERRREDRHPMMLPVRAVEVDDGNQPIGGEFDLITREISSKGLGLIHMDRIDAERMAVQLSIAETEVNLVVALLWSGPLGPFYGAGGKFIAKLRRFPAGV